jgi:hypothetical protein
MIHDRSQNDASHHVRQHPRMATKLLHAPLVSRINRLSTDAALNVNGTI